MVRRNSLYKLAGLGWAFLVFGAMAVAVIPDVDPTLAPSTVPGPGPVGVFVAALVLILFGTTVVGRLRVREWRSAGRRVGLEPTDGGLLGTPDLAGTVDGRRVRARTIERRTSSSGSESGTTTYTVVETDLQAPADQGLVVATPDAGADVVIGERPDPETVDDHEVVAGSPELARAVLTDRVQSALAAPALLESVWAGDATGALLAAIPEGDGLAGMLTNAMQEQVESKFPDAPDTVGTQTKDLILDPGELEAQVEAVLAVADAFERATET